MTRLARDALLPAAMQGRWIEGEGGSSELMIDGAELVCFGAPVAHDWKDVEEQDGVLVVTLGIDDPAREDEFQRANITGLALTPEGELLVYNVKFGCEFVRPTGSR